MDSSRLPPQTPRRQLLKRIHRRSSVLPSIDHTSQLAASSSTSTARSSSRRTSLNPDSASPLLGNTALEKHDEADEDYEQGDYNQHDASSATREQFTNFDQTLGVYEDGPAHNDDIEEQQSEGDENGETAAWAHVDELMDTLQLRNQRILELEKSVSQLQRDLHVEKDRAKSSKGKAGAGNAEDKGLTRAAAVKLEREFLSQEMILKGLQRDNEDKTLEVEALRRKIKVMSDFLARQYGQDGWEDVVFASSGVAVAKSAKDSAAIGSPEKEPLSAVARVLASAHAASSPRAANRPKFTPNIGSEAMLNPFSPAASSPTKGLGAANNDDMLIPTIARMQTPSSSPNKLFVPAFPGLRAPSANDADTSVDEVADVLQEDPSQDSQAATVHMGPDAAKDGLPAGLNPDVLLASIESVRLLIQGFERQNAMRRAELESTIENALEAERRAERLQASASTAPPTILSSVATSIPAA